MQCSKCSYENPVNSKYCQQCGTKLKVKKSVFSRENISNTGTIAGAGAKGVSVAPLAYRKGQESGNDMGQSSQPSQVQIPVTPLEDGTWYCPLCGDKNKGQSCRGCGFER